MNSDVSIEVFRNNFFVSLKEIFSHAEDEIVTEELYKKVAREGPRF